MRFDIFNRAMVEKYNATEKHVVISLRNPKSEKPKLSESCQDSRLDALYLEVDDSDKDGKGRVLFTEQMASKIWTFVNYYKDKVDLIVINCEAGISRSSAVGAALSNVINGNDKDFFRYFYPNMYIYRKVLTNKREESTNEKN